jgi:SAM-dependent methyltransferase
MREKGWTVAGVEVDPKAVEQARAQYGLEVFCGEVQEAHLPGAAYDAITLRHVIEHVPDPVALLKHCRKLLKPGGLLVVVTPNTESLGYKQFGPHWMGLDVPRHLMLFNPRSLATCAEAAQCRVLSLSTSAANAATFFAVSLSLTTRAQHAMGHHGKLEPLRVLKAFAAQYREAMALKRQPWCGEELVLLASA